MVRIIVVEDDRLLNDTLSLNLKIGGYDTQSFYSYGEAMKGIEMAGDTLLVMDVNLGDGNGFELVREMKDEWRLPVIFLTANDMESDMLKGYELGAEDYVTKPFSIPIFMKKCSAIIKRLFSDADDVYYDGHLRVDFSTAQVARGEDRVQLTPLEFRMLRIFIGNAGNVLTRNVLLDKLWDASGNYVDEHTLTTNVNRLRGKIEDEEHHYIRTIYGMGYMWIGVQ